MQQIITLITDFGLKDSFAGVMKGVLYSINPNITIIDINHNIARHNIQQCAINIKNSYSYFPKGTIHLAIVDPGVGTMRNPLIVESNQHYFIGPDNGIFSYIYENNDCTVYRITANEYFLNTVSSSFHGRDIFSPIAANLSITHSPEKFGTVINEYVSIELKKPKRDNSNIYGEIIYVDSFGNLMTNIENKDVDYNDEIFVNDISIGKLSSNYSEGKAGTLIAIHGSNGTIEIAMNQASAAGRYKILPCVRILKTGKNIKVSNE